MLIPEEGRIVGFGFQLKMGFFGFLIFLGSVQQTEGLGSFPKIMEAENTPRVLAFGWLALRGSILTMDNLQHKRIIVVNACPMCLGAEDSVDHLLLNCSLAKKMWWAILNLFDCS